MAGGGGDGSSGAEGCGGAKDGANVPGILNTGEDNDKWRAFVGGSGEEVFELCGARDDERGYALRVFGVGEAFEEAIGGGKNWKGNFGAVNQRRQLAAMTLAGFAEKYGFDFAGGGESFFDEADAFDADGVGFGGETAAKSHAEEFEPAVVAGGDGRGAGFGRGH